MKPGLLSILRYLALVGAVAAGASALAAENQQVEDDGVKSLEQLLSDIADDKADIEHLDARVQANEGLAAEILKARLDRIWVSMFGNTLLVAKEVASQSEDNAELASYREELIADLAMLPAQVRSALQRLLDQLVLPASDLSAQEIVVADQQLRRQVEHQDAIYRALLSYTEIAGDFGLDPEQARNFLVDAVVESAANRSAFLEIALTEVATLRPAVATLPGNTDLAARLSAADARVGVAAEGLESIIDLMRELEMETRQYTQQVIAATGEITTDVLDLGFVAGLFAEWGNALARIVAEDGLQLVFRLLLVFIIVIVAYQFAKISSKLVDRGLTSSRVNISNLLHRMAVSSARNLILFLGFMIAISQLGISLGPLLAGLGIAGFIVGFALQDTLGNFASGLLILFYRPFDVGDFVSAGGVEGSVSHMSLVNTTFMTIDNQRLVVPNNQIWGAVIRNVTAQTTRRIDMIFGISYESDIEHAERVFAEVIAAQPAVLDDPEPMIRVHELGDSSVNFAVRPWVATEDYWETYWSITREVKLALDAAGISIPYPQRDIHIIEQTS